MSIAIDNATHETFAIGQRHYRWEEGDSARSARAEALRGRRDALRVAFVQTVVPGLGRRGAATKTVPVGPRRAVPRAYWTTWTAPGDARPVWALYASTRCLSAESVATLGRAANDGAVLVAWGDGPVLAWASERPELRMVLRQALRSLPGFLGEGLCSGDATFPVKIVAA